MLRFAGALEEVTQSLCKMLLSSEVSRGSRPAGTMGIRVICVCACVRVLERPNGDSKGLSFQALGSRYPFAFLFAGSAGGREE